MGGFGGMGGAPGAGAPGQAPAAGQTPPSNPGVAPGGMSEEQMLEEAIRLSLEEEARKAREDGSKKE